MLLFDGDAERRRTVPEPEARRIEDAIAADGQQAFRRAERRLHEDLCHVSWLIALLVGNERDLLLLDLARGRQLPAAHPTRDAALILAAQLIHNHGGDLVAPADG